MVGDVLLAGSALGLYSYFKKKGGARLPTRKTKSALATRRNKFSYTS
jgi:hypothetical protein